MKVSKFLSVLFFLLALCFPVKSSAQPAEAWETIFNGKNFEGWSIIGGAGKFDVADSAFVLHMTANTTEHTFARTNKMYKDFILEVECKRDSTFYYGILFRARPAPDTAHVRLYGYQVKVDHSAARKWTGGIFDDFGNTWHWMYTLADDNRAQQALKKAGEWDHYRIEAIGNHIKVWLNGIPTSNLINDKYQKGYIAFKIHFMGNEPEKEKVAAWIKNVRIVTIHPEKYARPMDIPAKNAE